MKKVDFQLIETFLYTPGADRPVQSLLYPPSPNRPTMSDMDFALMKLHLLRLRKSGNDFAFNVGRQYARRCLFKAVKAYQKESGKTGTLRVRLLLSHGGNVEVTCFPLTPAPEGTIISFAISDRRVNSEDILLRHKTTKRELFDTEHASHNKKNGADEVLFLNEHDELCEGSRSNLFILGRDQKEGDALLTPPLSCGLLPGTLRQHMLAIRKAKEAVLTMSDLESAQEIYFGNSVRGLQKARLLQ